MDTLMVNTGARRFFLSREPLEIRIVIAKISQGNL